MPKSRVNHIDCFSGPGGICTGFGAAGINTVAAIEKVESCVQTYSANHPMVNVIHKDIREVDEEDIRRAIGRKHIHLVTSGMPCETFSTAGSSSRSHYDYRQQLYSEAIRIAVIVNADLILFENVPAILTKKVEKDGDRLVIQDILSELSDNGYLYTAQYVLKAVEFGVPQTRERFFLLASRRADLLLRAPVAPEGQRPVTVRDAFAGLPIMHANANDLHYDYTGEESDYTRLLKDSAFWRIKDNPELTFFNSPTHRKGTLKRFELIAPNQSLIDIFKSRSDEELAKLKKERVISDKWYIQRNKRLQWDAPSKTVTSHCLDELLHPELNRALSVRECARLQSFPDSYIFRGPYIIPHKSPIQDMYEQIGDAVPPLLAYHWGRTIRKILGR